MHADVVGSTKLIQIDESVAHTRMRDSFRKLSETISSYGGITWEIRGDALVAEFPRASDAIAASVSFQASNSRSTIGSEDGIHPVLRIGISLGEVIVADNVITGAGIVVAQRLEQLAAPGGVVVQGSVMETVPNRLPFEFEPLGEQDLKGFDQPVRAYAVRLTPGAEAPGYEGPASIPSARVPSDALKQHSLALPEKPSIAILPFVNLSDNPEQEFFADGLTEDIITRLSYLRGLFVLERSSSFALKGRSLNARETAAELGVRFILQGSVRRAGERVRIVAQLVDGSEGETTWAQRYDRNMSDVFAIQDEIAQAIVVAMQVELTEGEIIQSSPGSTTNVDAWEKFHQGMLALLTYSPDEVNRSRRLLREAIELDPEYIDARVYLAWTYWQDSRSLYTPNHDVNLATCRKIVDELNTMGASTADTKHLDAATLLLERRHDEALKVARTAVPMGPSKMFGFTPSALVFLYSGDVKTALEVLRTTVRMYPYTPSDTIFTISYSLCLAGELNEAVDTAEEYMRRVPTDLFAYTLLAIAYMFSGATDRARETISRFRKSYPTYTLANFAHHEPFRNKVDLQRVTQALREAGLPE